MSKALKDILDTCNDEMGFDRASPYIGNTDQNIRTLVAVANRSAQVLRDLDLQDLVRQQVTDLATATQDLSMDPAGRVYWVDLPNGFYKYRSDTLYQDGRIDPAQLPTPPETWAYLISRSGPQSLRVRCRILKDRLYIFSPDATQNLNFEYFSGNPITVDTTGRIVPSAVTTSDVFTTDNDTWELDPQVIELEIIWRYKRVKGLDWQDDYNSAQQYQNLLRARDGGATTLYPPNAWPYPSEPYTNLWVQN